MRILAIDPGYDRLGVAVLEKENGKEKLIHSECIETDRSLNFPERLLVLGGAVEALFEAYKPDGLATETLFFGANQTTAMAVAGVRGMVTYIAKSKNCAVFEYSPQEIKVAATGYGKSDKQAVIDMVRRLIPEAPKEALDDEYDAIAIGITCLAHTRR